MNAHMTPKISCIALVVGGILFSGWLSAVITDREDLDAPLNPMGVNRSPYGEVFAMAMQGPINRDFHVGMYGSTDEEIMLQHSQTPKNDPGSLLIVKPEPKKLTTEKPTNKAFLDRMAAMIEEMRVGHVKRTNELPASEMLKFYLRRKAEDKLRLAYQLDPSHYANYNALHFFLIEGITTRPEKALGAGQLARETIDYCLSTNNDPLAALTAAAACTNILHIMFNAERLKLTKQYTLEEMEQVLAELDQCLATYHRIAEKWDASNHWEHISIQRIHACEKRIRFITNIRNAAAKTIIRIQDTHTK